MEDFSIKILVKILNMNKEPINTIHSLIIEDDYLAVILS